MLVLVSAIAGVFFVLFAFLLVYVIVKGRNPVADLSDDLAEAQRLLGEERANHARNMEAVQERAATNMREYKAKLDLENAEQKRATARDTAARSRVALVAKISEHFAPLLAGFPYNFKDVRHVGELFDFLVFDGLEEGKIRKVVFLEVKTRRSGGRVSNAREKLLRDAINDGRVAYEVYVPNVEEAKRDSPSDATTVTGSRRSAVGRAQPDGA